MGQWGLSSEAVSPGRLLAPSLRTLRSFLPPSLVSKKHPVPSCWSRTLGPPTTLSLGLAGLPGPGQLSSAGLLALCPIRSQARSESRQGGVTWEASGGSVGVLSRT